MFNTDHKSQDRGDGREQVDDEMPIAMVSLISSSITHIHKSVRRLSQ